MSFAPLAIHQLQYELNLALKNQQLELRTKLQRTQEVENEKTYIRVFPRGLSGFDFRHPKIG